MNEELISHQIEIHEKRISNHAKRLDKIEQSQSEFKIEIKNLCENLKTLTNTLKWFMGIWVTSLLGFFFYAIQHNILK